MLVAERLDPFGPTKGIARLLVLLLVWLLIVDIGIV